MFNWLKSYELKDIVEPKEVNTSVINKTWMDILLETNLEKQKEQVALLWQNLGFTEVAGLLRKNLKKIFLVCTNDEYSVVYSFSDKINYVGNFNPNLEQDMIDKFGGIDPIVKEITTTLHDGFYFNGKSTYGFGDEGMLLPIKDMRPMGEYFIDGEYIDEERFDEDEFEDAGIILNEDTIEDFSNETIVVASGGYMNQVCRNIKHLDYYIWWSTKDDLELHRPESLIEEIDSIICGEFVGTFIK